MEINSDYAHVADCKCFGSEKIPMI